ncbi:inosine/xanthosine triphosphatase [uncultured Shewanella sp.]|uniref:inosine/xanthosine triphosphatase n=1 Tax=uncultured Shewanella sp. TaxID=173975 RepID=UPI002637E8CB|nr:inosine/xanthosine triphosphatase [uncultured Shewanella sp.]
MQELSGQKRIRVLIGSTNPVKINAAKVAICQLFPESNIECIATHAPSGVANQPMTERETRLGALNRVRYCQSMAASGEQEAELFVAMEGGVDKLEHGPATFAYIAVATAKQISVGRSALLPLPSSVYHALEAGEELGDVMDRLFNTKNIKQQGGAIGLLTKGHATRESIYTQALILAMAPLLNPELYQD